MKEEMTCGGSKETWLERLNKSSNSTDSDRKHQITARLNSTTLKYLERKAAEEGTSTASQIRKYVRKGLQEVDESGD